MSTVDLAAAEHGFSNSEGEECEEATYESRDGGRSEREDEFSSSGGEEGQRRPSQTVDYSQLELAQRHRSRGQVNRRGCSAGTARVSGSSRRNIGGAQATQGQRCAEGGGMGPAEGGQETTPSRRVSARERGRGPWRGTGRMASVGGVHLFTNRASGGARLQPIPDAPAAAPLSPDNLPVRHRRPRRQRVKKNGNWSDDQLRRALAEVDNGVTMKRAAVNNDIPYTTFRDWCYGKTRSRKRSVKGVFTPHEEAQIVQFLITMCDR